MDLRPIVKKENIYRERMGITSLLSIDDARKKAAILENIISQVMIKLIYGNGHNYFKHGENVAKHSIAIAKNLGMSRIDICNIGYIALLHDIGKMQIPQYLLDKSTPNSTVEKMVLQNHPYTGKRLMMDQFTYIGDVLLCHHERLDGSGYPIGLKSDRIPYDSKIIAVADVYDGMVGKRNYQPQKTPLEAADYLVKNKGKLFDEEIVNVFLSHLRRTGHI